MNSRTISLAFATVITILSGTTLPSHADRSCPLGFTPGFGGCQKVVKVTIANICGKARHEIRVGRDVCRTRESNGSIFGTETITNSVASPQAKQEAAEKLTIDPDPGFTNPGTPRKQRKVLTASERVLIDHDSTTRQDYTEITFEVIILPSLP